MNTMDMGATKYTGNIHTCSAIVNFTEEIILDKITVERAVSRSHPPPVSNNTNMISSRPQQ